jgi:hypothetical protein
MSKSGRGGYLGGGTIFRASVGLLTDRTKKHDAKVQRERERFAAEQAAFQQSQTPVLIKADSPEGQKRLLKYKMDQERTKQRAERKAQRRGQKKRLPLLSQKNEFGPGYADARNMLVTSVLSGTPGRIRFTLR